MKKYNRNIDLNAGELFLLAFSGKDPKPAIEMIQEYGLSGLYLSNDNIPNIYSALNLSKIVQKVAKNRSVDLRKERGKIPVICKNILMKKWRKFGYRTKCKNNTKTKEIKSV